MYVFMYICIYAYIDLILMLQKKSAILKCTHLHFESNHWQHPMDFPLSQARKEKYLYSLTAHTIKIRVWL